MSHPCLLDTAMFSKWVRAEIIRRLIDDSIENYSTTVMTTSYLFKTFVMQIWQTFTASILFSVQMFCLSSFYMTVNLNVMAKVCPLWEVVVVYCSCCSIDETIIEKMIGTLVAALISVTKSVLVESRWISSVQWNKLQRAVYLYCYLYEDNHHN